MKVQLKRKKMWGGGGGGGGHVATCQQREDINFMCSQELAISKRDI